jgi:hypothetical protein
MYARILPLTLFLLGSVAHSTEVIILYKPEEAVIAVDSLTTSGTTASPTHATECKIHRLGNVFWVSAGFTRNPALNFDVNKIVARSIRSNRTMDGILVDLGKEAVPALQKQLTGLKTQDPLRYRKMIARRSMLTFYILERTLGRILYMHQEFPIKNGVVTQGRPMQCSSQCVSISGSEAAQRYRAEHPNIWNERGIVGAVDFLMSLGINSEPNAIGPPVNVIDITPSSEKWLRRNNCPANKDDD